MSVIDRTSSEFRAFLELYEQAPLLELGQLADAERWRHHPEKVVTYIIDRNINYTNVCVADCKFCAFYRRPKDKRRLRPQLRADRRQDRRVQGHRRRADPAPGRAQSLHPVRVVPRAHALHQAQPSDPHPRLLARARSCSSASGSAFRSPEVVRELKAAGLDSIPGGGGEILVDEIRERVARKKAQTEEWLGVQEEAHRQGMKTSVTMMYGLGESNADRVEHLLRVRELQARTGGFTAFICWPLQPEGTPEMSHYRKTDAVTYLRTLALRADRPGQRAQPAVVLGDDGPQGGAGRPAVRRQ